MDKQFEIGQIVKFVVVGIVTAVGRDSVYRKDKWVDIKWTDSHYSYRYSLSVFSEKIDILDEDDYAMLVLSQEF